MQRFSTLLPDSFADAGSFQWTELSTENNDALARLHQKSLKVYPGLDKKGQASISVQLLTYQLATVLVHAFLSEQVVLKLPMSSIKLSIAPEMKLGIAVIEFIEPIVAVSIPTDEKAAHCMHKELVQCLAPIIHRQRELVRLSVGAQWRVFADATASACLAVGQALNKKEQSVALFHDLKKVDGSLLNNPQTRILSLNHPGNHYFVSRGGCCRFYSASTGDYCAGCIHRSIENQKERFTALLDVK